MARGLNIDYDTLFTEVAAFLGKDRDNSSISEVERSTIDAHIKAGLRMFYTSYSWSFLKPWSEISVKAGTWEYELPSDFGYLLGNIIVECEDRRKPMQLIGQTQLMGMPHDKEGIPRFYAVSPKIMSVQSYEQRFQLLIWPTPKKKVRLHLQYSVVPGVLSSSNPYPYGGMYHAETIKEACLAAAESGSEDTVGLHYQLFQNLLKNSIAFDINQSVADNLGYNGDGMRGARGKLDLRMFLNDTEINVPESKSEDDSIYWRP